LKRHDTGHPKGRAQGPQAIHAKLDELLKVHGDANNAIMSLDDKDADEVERERKRVKRSN
jgi:low affinity Fe/Cu permease